MNIEALGEENQTMSDITEPIKILLVDDKEENLLAMQSIMGDAYRYTCAYSAKETLKILLKEDDFALILMDVNMPEMNGFETASLIYKREKLTHIPIIFITSQEYNEDQLFKGYMSGGVDYIFKPVNPGLLRIKVQIFIELFKKNRQLIAHEQKLRQINRSLEEQINAKLRIEEELRLKNLQLSDAQKLTHLGSWNWNVITNKISGSDEIYDIYEIKEGEAEFSIEKLFEKIHPEDIDFVRTKIAEAITRLSFFDIYFRLISSDKQIKYINKKGRIITNGHNEVVKIFGTSQDITDLKKTEEQLEIFNVFKKMLNEIYVFSDRDFKVLYANDDALRNLGYTPDSVSVLSLFDFMTEQKKHTFKKIIEPLVNGSKDKIVFFDNFRRIDGTTYPVELHLQLIRQDEQQKAVAPFTHTLFLAVVLDLTERKRTEQVMAESLKEKEILLKEIHHRVKNNLQIISSLLNIQKGFIRENSFENLIDESRDRIRAMALLHEKLYQSKNLNQINYTSYITDLAGSLIRIYSGTNKKIDLHINSEVENVSIDTGISLGLILNELISNSIKHAFQGQSEGNISISFKEIEEGNLCLEVTDDGRGLPQDFNFETSESLGLQLVKSLVDQLKGELYISSDAGTRFEIKFANEALVKA